MAGNLVRHFKKNVDMISRNDNFKYVDLEKGLNSKQPRDYDHHISIRLFGFESTE